MKKFDNPLNYALYLLELRDRSVGEVREKMRLKKFTSDQVDEVIAFLETKQFLDDERFAKRYITEKQSIQHQGVYRIKIELKRKHISDQIIESALKDRSNDLELISAREASKKWQRKNRSCPEEKVYLRLGGYLSRQGFSYEVVKEVLNNMEH